MRTSPASTSPPGSHVAFIHYHKTGHDLSRLLQRALVSVLNVTSVMEQKSEKRTCLCEELPCPRRGVAPGTVIWTAPDLVLRPGPLPACYRVVHLVRDPARWSLSFYDYHRQVPTPESWVHSMRPECDWARPQHAIAIGMDAAQLDATKSACLTLVRPGLSYSLLNVPQT